MGSKWVLVLALFMFVCLQGCLSQISGCWEEERVSLLQLKHFFNSPNYPYNYYYYYYYYWEEGEHKSDWPVEGERNSDCCQWKRVECNNSTGRVIRLYLQEARGWGLGERYLNASLFSAFEELEFLDLSGNSIAGFVDNGGLDKLSRLRNLESLDLGGNMFNNEILSSLNALPSLTSLYLYGNRLNETVDLQGLDSCKYLKVLSLGSNQIEKVVFPKGLDKLSGLRNLERLYLGDNKFSNDIFSSINALPSLKSLDLSVNRLNETVDLQGLDKLSTLTNLEFLGLGGNMFNKDIFSSINALPSLKYLLLFGNRLNETVDLQGLDSSKNLTVLDLSNNQIEKVVFPKGLDSLEDLDVTSNPLEKFIFPEGSTGLRKLKTLDLSGLYVIDGSSLLQSLGSFPSLKTLDLSSSKFSDSTTNRDYLHNLTNAEELILDESFLHISLLQSIAAFTSFNSLSMSNCHINGILGFSIVCRCPIVILMAF